MYNMYPNQNAITWVQGIEGAKAYQLMPNSNVLLMDSENEGRFYIKVADNIGLCTLRTFKYEEMTNLCKNTENNVDMSQYVTRDELKQLLEELNNEHSVSKSKSKPATITE